MKNLIATWLADRHDLSGAAAEYLAVLMLIFLLTLTAFAVYGLLRRYLIRGVRHAIEKTSNTWDDAFFEAGLFHRLLMMVPLAAIYLGLDRISPEGLTVLKRVVFSLIILFGARTLGGFITAAGTVYRTLEAARRKPIRAYLQALKIIIYLFAALFIIANLLNKSPWGLFSVLGGLTAVLLLVFKDTILGFVAGIQLGAHDMVRVGDWIQMPKYGADGDVIDVTVNTVKVQNWDKTITTIPTYALISDSFINWRGMSESGGRRIKRSVHIDLNTVRFVDEAMLADFRKIELLREYVEGRQKEIDDDNSRRKVDLHATRVNGRRQTNLGIFRAYVQAYLRQHPKIHQRMTFLVRHLQPGPQGLPLEIYVFSKEQVWADYEALQADIFDHLLAALPEFGLRAFQQPAGSDLQSALKAIDPPATE
jgi:miniconductance mechanosensitive channel